MLNYIFFIENILANFWIKAIICLFTSFLTSFFAIKLFLKKIRNKNILHQPIRSDGPQSHISEKKNTPTMGGMFIIATTLITSLLFLDLKNHYILLSIFTIASFAAIGLTDDLMKVIYKNSKGFRGSIKLIIQFTIIAIVFVWLGFLNQIHLNHSIFLPFADGYYFSIGIFLYVLLVAFVIVGSSNAVNLTDGLDGLVSVPAMINLTCLSCLIYLASSQNIGSNFHSPFINNSAELIFVCISLFGSIFGFLLFNLKPAKIFMGDVGSLAIGSFLGLVAIIIKQEFIFFIISLLFVIEACSVILQVAFYKIYKRRIFLMAPIHHHFEKKGWSEKIVVRKFWIFSIFCAFLGMLFLLKF